MLPNAFAPMVTSMEANVALTSPNAFDLMMVTCSGTKTVVILDLLNALLSTDDRPSGRTMDVRFVSQNAASFIVFRP